MPLGGPRRRWPYTGRRQPATPPADAELTARRSTRPLGNADLIDVDGAPSRFDGTEPEESISDDDYPEYARAVRRRAALDRSARRDATPADHHD